jgi:hypothetical protein
LIIVYCHLIIYFSEVFASDVSGKVRQQLQSTFRRRFAADWPQSAGRQ